MFTTVVQDKVICNDMQLHVTTVMSTKNLNYN